MLALGLGALTGVGAALLVGSSSGASTRVVTGTSVALVLYALRALHARVIAGWALRRTLGSLGLLLPLATRAPPMPAWSTASSAGGAWPGRTPRPADAAEPGRP